MDSGANSRRDAILDRVVRSYIETAEPVGSRTISKRFKLGLSPASIRNVMADLEEEGFLKHPHTSAGRVPTDKGYRYWIDSLMEPEELSEDEKQWISEELKKARSIDGLADRVSKVISTLTKNAAMLYIKKLKRVSFLNYFLEELVEAQKLSDFLEEDSELFIEGAFHVFEQPEFQDVLKMRHLLQAFEEKLNILRILVRDLELEGVQVHIGMENSTRELEDVSLVVKDCYLGGLAIGGVAAVGPTRMRYAKVVSVVDYVADGVTQAVQRF
jgi:heat-inducible transcriptional repressor